MGLSKEHIARYSRQLVLPEVGVRGQQRLAEASVLVIGAGGLGSPAALYLAAAGVGRLGIVDDELVALSNLHRQILYETNAVGAAKSAWAKSRLSALNPDVDVEAIQEPLTSANGRRFVASYDLVLDGSDNFQTRYLVNDACVLERRPFVHGAVVRFEGQLLAVVPEQSACLRCVFPEPPAEGAIPSCQEAGILGACAGVIGSLMAHEALKVLLNIGERLTDRLLVFEGMASRFREVPLRRDRSCAVCGEHPTIQETSAVVTGACSEVR